MSFNRNVCLLALCQAFGMSGSALIISVTALGGRHLSLDTHLATVPLGLQYVTMMCATLPASLLMKRVGRRNGFQIGAILGIVAGLTGAMSFVIGSFFLFCGASVMFGTASVFVQYYRFAAIEIAQPEQKNRAISLVMAGGVAAGLLGPAVARWTYDLIPSAIFAGSFIGLSALFAIKLVAIRAISFAEVVHDEERLESGKSYGFVRNPGYLLGVLCAASAYGCMNILMAPTPLAMAAAGHDFDAAAIVIQWHIVAMYLPSFVTGHLIDRFGVTRIIAAGTLLLIAAAALNMAGVQMLHFLSGLIVLGIAWNFIFVGATALLTECYGSKDKARAQGLNDMAVFATITMTALVSGSAVEFLGWQGLNLSVIPVALVLFLILLPITLRRGRFPMARTN